jgi:transcription elongation factor Elf1
MSDWLMQGLAAAKSNDKEMARFYLERALGEFDLMPDTDLNDRLDAYYWLSHVTDDPAQKRNYLEEALAINPAHPEARRDLAILDGRLKPEEIVDPERARGAVAPDAAPAVEGVRRFACPRCGGKQAYDADAGTVVCSFCGYRLGTEEARNALVAEGDFPATLYTARAHQWALPARRALRCESCGARFVLPPSHVAGNCPFCGAAHVVEDASAGLIEPHGIVPFRVDAAACVERIREWLKTREFAPGDLTQRSAIVRPRGVYLPFWIFDTGGSVGWRGTVQEYDPVRRQLVGIARSGQFGVMLDNLPVPAGRALDAGLLRALTTAKREEGFDLSQSVPYADGYLADWSAEIYTVALADASLQARQTAVEQARAQMAATIPDGVRDLTTSSADVVVNTYQLVLLPVWIAAYRYKERDYPLAVNGQSGAVHGDVPRSGWQRLAAGIAGERQ